MPNVAVRIAVALTVAALVSSVERSAWAVNVTCGTTVQRGQTGTVSGTVNCTCGNTSSYCVKVVEGGLLKGGGTLACPVGSTTCTEAAIKVDSGGHASGAIIDGDPGWIRIAGSGARWRGAADNGKNFKLGVFVTGSGIEATVRDVTNARCVKATDTKNVHIGATVSIDNRGLVNAQGNPISGLNCTRYWLEAIAKSTITFTADTGGVCCCKITPTTAQPDGTAVTLNLAPGNGVACTNCSGCC